MEIHGELILLIRGELDEVREIAKSATHQGFDVAWENYDGDRQAGVRLTSRRGSQWWEILLDAREILPDPGFTID